MSPGPGWGSLPGLSPPGRATPDTSSPCLRPPRAPPPDRPSRSPVGIRAASASTSRRRAPASRSFTSSRRFAPDTGARVLVKGSFSAAELVGKLDELTDGAAFVLGHNVRRHDLAVLGQLYPGLALLRLPVVDTLELSPLAFPENPYHRLVKDYKLVSDARNDPLRDAELSLTLFLEEQAAFRALAESRPDDVALFHFLLTGEASGGSPIDVRRDSPRAVPDCWSRPRAPSGGPSRSKVCRTRLAHSLARSFATPAATPRSPTSSPGCASRAATRCCRRGYTVRSRRRGPTRSRASRGSLRRSRVRVLPAAPPPRRRCSRTTSTSPRSARRRRTAAGGSLQRDIVVAGLGGESLTRGPAHRRRQVALLPDPGARTLLA